ncbi:MAG: GNAT family N-acetyltransferase, partial [Anaerolineales bacterium]
YALADLDPEHARYARWLTGEGALVLIYSGLTPPVLFAHGDPGAVFQLLAEAPPAQYQYTLLPTHRALLGRRLRPHKEMRMWRMALRPSDFRPEADPRAVRLEARELPEIEAMFAGHPDRPDAFHPRQLDQGTFYGIREAGVLAAVAGVHVRSLLAGVAAIGNVFTLPQARGRGLGGAVSSAVVADVLKVGVATIVLNVAMDNSPALRVYRRLGFMPFCGYYEGVGLLLDSEGEGL